MRREEIKEKVKEAVKSLKDEWAFKEEYSKRAYWQTVSIWENGNKFRVYVPRNAFEQAGYITLDVSDIKKGSENGKYKGFFYSATRPGNVDTIKEFIDALIEIIGDVEVEYDDSLEGKINKLLEANGYKNIFATLWENYGKKRLYLNYVDHKKETVGYIDLNSEEVKNFYGLLGKEVLSKVQEWLK